MSYYNWQNDCAGTAPLSITLSNGRKTRRLVLSPVIAWILFPLVLLLLISQLVISVLWFMRSDIADYALYGREILRKQYEQRIAELRTDRDQIAGSANLSQTRAQRTISELARQITELQDRQSQLLAFQSRLSDLAGSGGTLALSSPKPADQHARLLHGSLSHESSDPFEALQDLEADIMGMESRNLAYADMIGRQAKNQTDRLVSALQRLDLPDMNAHIVNAMGEAGFSAQGGPFIEDNKDQFGKALADTQNNFLRLDGLQKFAEELPLFRPGGRARITSNFGFRIDPINRRRSKHEGMDFGMAIGSFVRATAAGRVRFAGKKGGYGNLVELAHRHRLSTRYGHLDQILVRAGEWVEPGEIIAHSGNTGRSTGPHLHYEIRQGGHALDPALWIGAGDLLENPPQNLPALRRPEQSE